MTNSPARPSTWLRRVRAATTPSSPRGTGIVGPGMQTLLLERSHPVQEYVQESKQRAAESGWLCAPQPGHTFVAAERTFLGRRLSWSPMFASRCRHRAVAGRRTLFVIWLAAALHAAGPSQARSQLP